MDEGELLVGAACAGLGPEGDALFFPPTSSTATDRARFEPARRICEGCPVRMACLERAMAAEKSRHSTGRFGMWGGKTPQERFTLYRSRHSKRRRAA